MKGKQIYIADTLHNTIELSILEKKIISTQLFNRLHDISQNSTAYLTFPTNRTKRFEHSIGTMKLCGEIFYYSISNSSKSVLDDFISDLKENIHNEFIKRDFREYRKVIDDSKLESLEEYSEYNIDNTLYDIFVPKNITQENVFLYLVVFQAVRIAALLHDIGHPPFSHITENAIKKAFLTISGQSNLNSRKQLFKEIIEEYSQDNTKTGKRENFQLHEQLGNKMTERILENIVKECDEEEFDIQYFNILSTQIAVYMLNEKSPFFKQIHSIIDGAIDGDRLDYVSRDVINSGFESGRIEYSRLISSMELCKYKNEYVFSSSIKVINTVEDFFFRRWKLYKNIIYHHRVIKTDHLLQDSIYEMIIEYLDNTDDEIPQQKGDFRLANDISGLWKPLKLTLSNQKYFDALIQWDDGWLLSILKQYYFSEGYKKDNRLKYQLEELLSNKKQFYSIIKDTNDFKNIDEKILENISIDFDKVKEFGKDLDDTYNELICSLENKYKNKENIKNGYFLFDIKLLIDSFFQDKYKFSDLMTEMIHDFVNKEYKKEIGYYFIEFKSPNYGLSKMPYIIDDKEVKLLNQVSNIGEILAYDGLTFPVMHIYIKKNDDFKYDDFIERLAKSISQEWNKFFKAIS